MRDSAANADQIAYWNDKAGHTWAHFQPMLDRQIGPLGARAIASLAPELGEAILDIGCGCGDTTMALALATGPTGRVLGADISAPMLNVARRRAAAAGLPQAYLLQADAQTQNFPAKFDAAFSRFGVMFFADPTRAFGNIAASLRPGGRLAFVCWRSADENPWMMVPMQAAAPLLPPAQPADPLAPGPFAFADANRINTILTHAGFTAIEIAAHDTDIGGFSLPDATKLALRVGPLGQALRDAPDLGPALKENVAAALACYETQAGVLLASATWIVTARR